MLALVTLFISALVAVAITSPFALYPGSTFFTYRGLVNRLVVMNYGKLSQRFHAGNPDVWMILQSIIVEQLGVKKEDVTPEADFVYDLGCN